MNETRSREDFDVVRDLQVMMLNELSGDHEIKFLDVVAELNKSCRLISFDD